MKSVFSISGDDDGSVPAHGYDLTICFNGMPGTVVLEVSQTTYPASTSTSVGGSMTATIMRSILKASHARAIASALLSAATEVRQAAID